MSPPELQPVGPGDDTDLYAIWTRDFAPAQYCSVYLLDTERPAIVDTGTGANVDRILAGLSDIGIEPADLSAIVLTHVHLDHAGGAGRLARACPNATVFVHESGADHLVDPERLWEGTKAAVGEQIQYYAEPRSVPESRVTPLTAGETIDLGERELAVHRAPGHAFHQVVYEEMDRGGVFTGDAAGVLTPGLDAVRQSSPPPGFDLDGCLEDVEMIRSLDPSALYLAHYGQHEPLPLLENYAEVLQGWVRSVAAKRNNVGAEATIEYFATRTGAEAAWGRLKAREEERMNVRGALEYLAATEDSDRR